MHVHGQKNRSIVTQCPWRDGVGGRVPSTFPFSNFRANTVGPIWKFFHWQCSKDVPTNKKFVWNNNNNNSSHHWEEKPIWCWAGPPHPTVGHQRVKICQLLDLSTLFISAINFVHFSNQLKLTQKNVNPLNFTRNKWCIHSFSFHLNVEVV